MSVIFLSASVPSTKRAERYLRVPDCQLHIEEAVVSLARAVFSHGGRLVFGGHPTIVPLVSMVAAEYRPTGWLGHAEQPAPMVVVYQSSAYEDVVTDGQRRMVEMGLAQERRVEAVAGEKFDPDRRGEPQCEQSLAVMRERMIVETNPDAMVCAGGMEGVEKELDMYTRLKPYNSVWLLAFTGGATAIAAERYRNNPNVKIFDERDVLELKARLAGRQETSPALTAEEAQLPEAVPYPYLMQLILRESNEKGLKA
ncbi:MAG: hypothetical protein WCC84_15570 [Candidatus Cybelea sp.]